MSKIKPGPDDRVMALEELRDEWVCCPSCGRILFRANYIPMTDMQIKCGKCNTTIRVVIGQLTID